MLADVSHKYLLIDGMKVFVREAGRSDAPVPMLPFCCSHMAIHVRRSSSAD